jgi:hypothetical protein
LEYPWFLTALGGSHDFILLAEDELQSHELKYFSSSWLAMTIHPWNIQGEYRLEMEKLRMYLGPKLSLDNPRIEISIEISHGKTIWTSSIFGGIPPT